MRTSILLSAILISKAINENYYTDKYLFMLLLFIIWDIYDSINNHNIKK